MFPYSENMDFTLKKKKKICDNQTKEFKEKKSPFGPISKVATKHLQCIHGKLKVLVSKWNI